MTPTDRAEAAQTILNFLDGSAGPWDWDDFITPPRKDADYQEVVDFCATTASLYPATAPGGWCSEEGTTALRRLAEMLQGGEPMDRIRAFMDGAWQRTRAVEDSPAPPEPPHTPLRRWLGTGILTMAGTGMAAALVSPFLLPVPAQTAVLVLGCLLVLASTPFLIWMAVSFRGHGRVQRTAAAWLLAPTGLLIYLMLG